MGGDASTLRGAARKGDVAAVKGILSGKSEADAKKLCTASQASNGRSAIHYAAAGGSGDIIKLLVQAGVDPNILTEATALAKLRGKAGRSAIVIASKHSNSGAISALCECGANPDAAISSGFHALAISIEKRDATTCKVLLEAGANPRLPHPKSKLEPLQLACDVGDSGIVAILLQFGADPSVEHPYNGSRPLHAAARQRSGEMVKILLQYGADPDATGKDGGSALGIALANGDVITAGALLECGANPRQPPSRDGVEPLVMAADAGQEQMMAALLQYGAEPNTFRSGDQRAAIHICAEKGLLAGVQELLRYGANPQAPCNGGATALHLATKEGHAEIALELCAAGANPLGRDSEGHTPLHHMSHDNPSIVGTLLSYGADPNMPDGHGNCPAALALKHGRSKAFLALTPYTAPQLLLPLFHSAVDARTDWAVSGLLQQVRVCAADVRAAWDRVAHHRAGAEGRANEMRQTEQMLAMEDAGLHAQMHTYEHQMAKMRTELDLVRGEDKRRRDEAMSEHQRAVRAVEEKENREIDAYNRALEAWNAQYGPGAQGQEGGAGGPGPAGHHGGRGGHHRGHGGRGGPPPQPQAPPKQPRPEFKWKPDPRIGMLERDVSAAESEIGALRTRLAAVHSKKEEVEAERRGVEATIEADARMMAILTSVVMPEDRNAISYMMPQRAYPQQREMRQGQRAPRLLPLQPTPSKKRVNV